MSYFKSSNPRKYWNGLNIKLSIDTNRFAQNHVPGSYTIRNKYGHLHKEVCINCGSPALIHEEDEHCFGGNDCSEAELNHYKQL